MSELEITVDHPKDGDFEIVARDRSLRLQVYVWSHAIQIETWVSTPDSIGARTGLTVGAPIARTFAEQLLRSVEAMERQQFAAILAAQQFAAILAALAAIPFTPPPARCACCGIERPAPHRRVCESCIAADCLVGYGCDRVDSGVLA